MQPDTRRSSFNPKDYFAFYEAVGRLYPEERIVYLSGWGRARRRFVRQLLRRYGREGAWLDVGCGAGVYLREAKRIFSKLRLFGLDVSPAVLFRARRKVAEANLICGDAQRVPLRTGAFDFIVCSETVEHLPEPRLCFSEIARLLAPGGVAVITCPNWHKKRPHLVDVGVLRCFGVEGERYIHTAFRPEELAELAESFGLAVLERGDFEREMRLWGRVFDAAFGAAIKLAERLGLPRRLIRFLVFAQALLSGAVYELLRLVGVAALMRRVFRRGPRSYVVVKKA